MLKQLRLLICVIVLPSLFLCPSGAAQQVVADPDASGALSTMPGYASLEGFKLNEPNSNRPLMNRYIEVISVVGKVDPPFEQKNDRIDLTNQEYNEPNLRKFMDETPGLVFASITVFIEEVNREDNRIQLWEDIIVRVYNADKKEDATHYCDTTIWKTQPGFRDITSQDVSFSDWRPIKKKSKRN